MASQVLVNLLNEYFLSRYCNNRIIMFSKDGTYISEWGERSKSVLGKCFQKPQKALSFRFLYNLFISHCSTSKGKSYGKDESVRGNISVMEDDLNKCGTFLIIFPRLNRACADTIGPATLRLRYSSNNSYG